jgi:hypothetical protein
MEKKNTSVFYNGLVWGAILGFAGVIYSVLLYMLDQTANQALGYVSILISLVLLVLGMKSYRNSVLDGVMPFGKAFGFGMVVIAVSALIGTIYQYIMVTVIDPDIMIKMMEAAEEKMISKGIPDEALEQAMNITKKFMQPGLMAAIGLATSLFFGTIMSLIVAAIMKKEDENAVPV